MNQIKYAACTLCKNEESNVKEWLKRTEDFDFRIVVDTGSTDNTVSLFSEVDNIIFEQKKFNPFQFDTVRNYILTLVPKEVDWVFWPSLDEYYDLGWRSEMENISSEATRVLYHTIQDTKGIRKLGIESNTIIDCKIHKNRQYKWVKPIHELLSFTGDQEKIVYADISRIHYRDTTQERHNQWYDMAIRAVDANPTDDYMVWFALLGSYQRRDPYKVIKYGTLYIDLTKPNTDFRVMAYKYIAEAYLFLSQLEQDYFNAT